MNLCPMCGSALPERAIFCPACAKQARCKVCRDALEPNARACVSCGVLIGEGTLGLSGQHPLTGSSAVNVLKYQDDKAGRSLNFNFTDAAMATVGETLVYALDHRLMPRDVPPPHRGAHRTLDVPLQLAAAASREEVLAPPHADGHKEPNTATTGSDLELLREVFHQEGTTLHLDEPRLKADSRLDYARRLSFLFVYAHEHEGRPQVQRADLNAILEKAYDTNTKTFLRTHPGFERDGEMFRLNKQGKDEAKAALKRVFDTSVEGPGWMPGAKAGKDKDDESKSSAKTAGKRGRKASTKPKEWAQKWKAGHASVDGHSLLSKRTNTEKGIFALWAVSTVASDNGKVVSEGLLSKFLLEALVFKLDARVLARALQSAPANGKVLKVQGGFQLQPPGSQWALDLVNGKSV